MCGIRLVNAWTKSELEMFNAWKKAFNVTCIPDENKAIENFMRNHNNVEQHNLFCNNSYSLGLWEKSIYTESDLNSMLNGLRVPKMFSNVTSKLVVLAGYNITSAENVTNFNWTAEGAVNTIRDQSKAFQDLQSIDY